MSDEDDMSNNNDDDDVDGIVRIQKNDPSFHHYRAEIYYEDDTSQLAEALQGNTHLKTLSIKRGPNVHDKTYAENLASAVANAKLTRLTLDLIHSRNDEDRYVTRCLLGAVKRSPTIQHLRVCTVMDDDNICHKDITSCMPHVQRMLLIGTFAAGGVELLCDGIQRTATLTCLHLGVTNFGSAGDFRLLSVALANNSSITSLRVDYCEMDDDCVKAFLEHWHHDSQISTLAFVHAGIKAEGAMLLIQAASSHPAMESLSIERNAYIGYDGLANIATELPNAVLKLLNVAACAVPNLSEVAAVVGGLIAQGVKANTHLIEIDVSGNGFDADAEQDVEETLAFYTLRNKYSPLMASELHVPASFWCDCFANNGRNASFIFHFLREQPMLWHACRKDKR